jgi:hypothetical protein
MDAWLWVTLVSKIMQEYFNYKLSIFEVTYIIRYFYLSFNNILVSCLDIRNFIHIRGTNFLSPAIKGKLNLRSIEIINLAFTESQLCHSMLPAYYLSRFVFQCNDNFRSLSLWVSAQALKLSELKGILYRKTIWGMLSRRLNISVYGRSLKL